MKSMEAKKHNVAQRRTAACSHFTNQAGRFAFCVDSYLHQVSARDPLFATLARNLRNGLFCMYGPAPPPEGQIGSWECIAY